MKVLNTQQIDDVFERLYSDISDYQKVSTQLTKLKPSNQYELEGMGWRYRLIGFIEGLSAAEILSTSVREYVQGLLFGSHNKTVEGERPGKKYKYSVDIRTEQNNTFKFDVPSMNPYDAYFQLTKRVAYKSIPGIESVMVYAGFKSQRLSNSLPLKVFSKGELVYVTLL